MYSEDRIIECGANAVASAVNPILGAGIIEKSRNLSNSSRIGRENTTFSRENHHSNKNSCMEDEPKVAEEAVQSVTSGSEYPAGRDITKAHAGGRVLRLDADLAQNLQTLAEMDRLVELRAVLKAKIKKAIENFMQMSNVDTLETCYYDFAFEEKRGWSRVNTKLLKEETDIFNYTITNKGSKSKLSMQRNYEPLQRVGIVTTVAEEVRNGF